MNYDKEVVRHFDFVVFPNTGQCKRKKKHGGHEYDDLQNWLDMTSHENPL